MRRSAKDVRMVLHDAQFYQTGKKAMGVGSGHLPPEAILTLPFDGYAELRFNDT